MKGGERIATVVDLPPRVREILAPGRRVVVTGCAGFIGSHLCEALLALDCAVVGVDCLTDYYDPIQKREHLSALVGEPAFEFLERDLLDLDAFALLRGAAVCFHLAAQAGVRASWGMFFDEYLQRNVLATQRLLEACKEPGVAAELRRFVYSSSSSVYGDQTELPVAETVRPAPRSPYGVTKLAAEHLVELYAASFGVPVSSLRYFTVYGPRQRPDMAFRKFIEAALDGRSFRVYGDGRQTRDFTYVDDAVRANLLAVAPLGGETVFNIGGGARISLREALDGLAQVLAARAPAARVRIEHTAAIAGDVRDTFADSARAGSDLAFAPRIALEEGLARQVDWVIARRRRDG